MRSKNWSFLVGLKLLELPCWQQSDVSILIILPPPLWWWKTPERCIYIYTYLYFFGGVIFFRVFPWWTKIGICILSYVYIYIYSTMYGTNNRMGGYTLPPVFPGTVRPRKGIKVRSNQKQSKLPIENSQARWWFQIFFNFDPYLGKWSNLPNIFQMGWNHQLAKNFHFPTVKSSRNNT